MTRQKKDKKEKKDGKKERAAWHEDLHQDTKNAVFAILTFIVAFLFVLSYIGKGGSAGSYIARTLTFLLGSGYFFAPLTFVLLGFSFLSTSHPRIVGSSIVGGCLFFISSLTLLEIIAGPQSGGFFGSLLGSSLLKLFDFWASLVICLGLLTISFLIMFNGAFQNWRQRQKQEADEEEGVKIMGETGNSVPVSGVSPEVALASTAGMKNMLNTINTSLQSAFDKKGDEEGSEMVSLGGTTAPEKEEALIALRKVAKNFEYKKPPIELLQGDRGKPSSGDIRANANVIKRTLENFGIDVEMGEVSIGPTVTQYTLKPAEGVKLSRITALGNDLSLALAAHPIRIEAPIPGKSLVGIEVPNRSVSTVGLRSLFEHKLFQESTQPLLFTLGRDVAGNPVFADLAKMPHLLISGSTGSGKSVSAHSIITSFLYRNPPEILRFILVDPKRVELSVYNDIPHLLTPVITDPKKTVQALRWATKEMDRRYELLSQYHTRDIVSFNMTVSKSRDEELLPYIVVMVDELADLMTTFPREVESAIIRLAQMARAVGIHLIVSTQRPSVEVITGLIKANITSRIAFQVASQIDSRTILDMAGAEKLLGSGDMLFLAGDTGKPRRIQGGFISEQEVKRVVDFLREESSAPAYNDSVISAKNEEGNGIYGDNDFSDDNGDLLYEEARQIVLEAGKASSSYIQRRLRVGYARAARLLDLMEERGVVGPADGAKPREILEAVEDDGMRNKLE